MDTGNNRKLFKVEHMQELTHQAKILRYNALTDDPAQMEAALSTHLSQGWELYVTCVVAPLIVYTLTKTPDSEDDDYA